jgi:hypothetical protein
MNHGTASAYRQGCRCDPCRDYNRATTRSWRDRNRPPSTAGTCIPDDGIIDDIAIERLAAGTLDWTRATLTERRECARVMFARGYGYEQVFAATRLRSSMIREVREVAV